MAETADVPRRNYLRLLLKGHQDFIVFKVAHQDWQRLQKMLAELDEQRSEDESFFEFDTANGALRVLISIPDIQMANLLGISGVRPQLYRAFFDADGLLHAGAVPRGGCYDHFVNRAVDLPVDERALEGLCRRYSVRRLAVFGSALRGELTPGSDLDILVEFEREAAIGLRFITLQSELSVLFGRKVDLLTAGFLSRHFRTRVLAEAVPLYEAA